MQQHVHHRDCNEKQILLPPMNFHFVNHRMNQSYGYIKRAGELRIVGVIERKGEEEKAVSAIKDEK